MLALSVVIGAFIVIPLSLLGIARARRRYQRTSLALHSLGVVSPQWLKDKAQ